MTKGHGAILHRRISIPKNQTFRVCCKTPRPPTKIIWIATIVVTMVFIEAIDVMVTPTCARMTRYCDCYLTFVDLVIRDPGFLLTVC